MRFVGFTCNIGDPMNFKVIQCNAYPHKRNIVVYRGVVVPDALCNFIAEHRIPRMIITDSDGVLGEGKKCKHYLRQIFTPL